MTVIAWDGKTLAADKMGSWDGMKAVVTKIFRVGDKLVGMAGDCVAARDVIDWIEDGCDLGQVPDYAAEDASATILCIDHGKVHLYVRGAKPVEFEDTLFAIGSGRDYALAAMYCGKSSRGAVEVASHFDQNCGCGIDELTP